MDPVTTFGLLAAHMRLVRNVVVPMIVPHITNSER